MEVRKILCPLVEAAGVDIVFNGHDHDYERTVPFNGTTYIVAGGGGAPLYKFMADSAWDAYKESITHFCILRVSGDTLKVSTVRASDGAVRDSFQVVHPLRVQGAAESRAPSATDSVVQFLLTAAATDFRAHRPPDPLRFRDVRLGHVITSRGERQYMLCGEFLPAQDGSKAQWTPFATIKTSGYEQWIGRQATPFCQDSSVIWDQGSDLSASLQSRLDSLR
jgi:hypothetical protein